MAIEARKLTKERPVDGEACAVTRRELLPVALVLLVTVTDAAEAPTLSFYLLLAAVPAIVVAGLAAVEEVLQPGALPAGARSALLHVVTLLLVLVAAALRAPLRAEGTVPRAAVSARDRLSGRLRDPGRDRRHPALRRILASGDAERRTGAGRDRLALER